MSPVLLRSEQTGGMASVVESSMQPRTSGPPLHLHDFDEAFYVLEGELTFQLRDDLLTAGPGELVFAPRCVPHTLANRGSAVARYLIVCTPAGFERHWDTDPDKPLPQVVRLGPPIPV